jgi:hypothetical protein
LLKQPLRGSAQYRKQNLIAQFGSSIPLSDLRHEIAKSTGAGKMHPLLLLDHRLWRGGLPIFADLPKLQSEQLVIKFLRSFTSS